MDVWLSILDKLEDRIEALKQHKARKRWRQKERRRMFVLKDMSSECVEDERIAMFLQNEEFLTELSINEDFLTSLDGDLGAHGSHDSDAFRDRLRHMGKVSKHKFTQLARVFQRRKKVRSGKEGAGDSLLLTSDSTSMLDGEGISQDVHKG